MGVNDTEKRILALAEECIRLGKQERPEKQWIGRMYERFRAANGMPGKAETDGLIFRKMYGNAPEKASDTLKIRYWRTGRHLPGSREQCKAFGRALELSADETQYLIQGYYDRCDRVFETEEPDAVYLERIRLLGQLKQEYLDKVHPVIRLQIYQAGTELEQSLRHLYYTDASRYFSFREPEKIEIGRHITSINYLSEFGRQMKLLGEIPRRTMIRHLLLFGMPFINRRLISCRLEHFGYLPLSPDHTQVDGSRLDWLLLGFLELYEECCTGKDPEDCDRWFREAYGILDQCLEKRGKQSLRFLYFKSLRGGE